MVGQRRGLLKLSYEKDIGKISYNYCGVGHKKIIIVRSGVIRSII